MVRTRGSLGWLAGLVLAALGAACSGPEEDAAVARGRAVYLANCSACHAADPSQEGGLGPAVAGASRELLEAKVLRGEYPPGYTPRRDTGVMPRFDHLADDIEALAAFLAPSQPD